MKVTREQIESAKHLADLSTKLASVDWHEQFLKNLNIEVVEPKPEPGVYLTKQGDVLTVNTERSAEFPDSLWITGTNGNGQVCHVNAHEDRATWHPLTPALVVPADKHTPRREQVWEAIKNAGGAYNMPDFDVESITCAVMALLRDGGR